MTSALQYSKEKIISESQQLGSNGPFLIHALKSIILKTIALKKSYEKKIRDDPMALLLSLPNYTKCDSEGRILQESAGQTPAR